jgi:hypothetical protein
MVHFLWSEGQEDLFSRESGANRPDALDRHRLRTLFRLIGAARSVESVLLLFPGFPNINAVRHRFERTIGGRCYLIEVAMVDHERWRASLLRIPGVPIAMMPFYGETPDEAATHLSDWLEQAHRPKAS